MEFSVLKLKKTYCSLGHTECGAVAAAVDVQKMFLAIVTLINEIKPAVAKCSHLPEISKQRSQTKCFGPSKHFEI
jgi:carbonic anhydrase